MSKINGGKEGCSAYISDILTEITNKGKWLAVIYEDVDFEFEVVTAVTKKSTIFRVCNAV
jgi:hypothetical protein